jgi:DNA-binding transcriptional MerR regulator
MDFEIQAPEKSTYKFNEVTSITGVKPYVLRFWESEFDQIDPEINDHGQKFYRPSDLEVIQKIKNLLFEEKLSIPEAKLKLIEKDTIDSSKIEKDVFSPVNLESKSSDLKLALEQIIATHSNPSSDISSLDNTESIIKADSVSSRVKSEIVSKGKLSANDIVKLVSAKKKLTSLMGKIDNISNTHNW